MPRTTENRGWSVVLCSYTQYLQQSLHVFADKTVFSCSRMRRTAVLSFHSISIPRKLVLVRQIHSPASSNPRIESSPRSASHLDRPPTRWSSAQEVSAAGDAVLSIDYFGRKAGTSSVLVSMRMRGDDPSLGDKLSKCFFTGHGERIRSFFGGCGYSQFTRISFVQFLRCVSPMRSAKTENCSKNLKSRISE